MAGCKKSRGIKPKMKTKSGAAKRFKKTASGKIKYFKKGARHGLSNKNRKHKRRLKKASTMPGSTNSLLKRLIPYL